MRRTVISGNSFHKLGAENYTGAVYWEVGARPYTAVIEGRELRDRFNRAILYKTAETAWKAIEREEQS